MFFEPNSKFCSSCISRLCLLIKTLSFLTCLRSKQEYPNSASQLSFSTCIRMAAEGKGTPSAHFVLLGFSEQGNIQVVLFVVFLVIYVVTLLGNVGLLVLIRLVAQLHIPMYFFLSSLAFLDLCYSSCITPRLLRDLLDEDKVISHACASRSSISTWPSPPPSATSWLPWPMTAT